MSRRRVRPARHRVPQPASQHSARTSVSSGERLLHAVFRQLGASDLAGIRALSPNGSGLRAKKCAQCVEQLELVGLG